jgi:hypothetical protein
MAKPTIDVEADAGLEQAKKSSPKFKKLLQEGHAGHGGHGSVREIEYKGHRITIRTTYEVRVDGKKFDAPLDVSMAGEVSYMGLMNVSFGSAMDLMKAVIDQFPDAFGKGSSGGGGSGHPGHSGHGMRRGMKSARKASKKAKG